MMADLGRSAIIIGLAYRAGCGAERVWPLVSASRQVSSIALVVLIERRCDRGESLPMAVGEP